MTEPQKSNPDTKPESNLPQVIETKPVVQDNQSDLPSFPTKRQIDEYKEFLANYDEFIDSQLVVGVDFGVIPGVEKPSLLKPGAEKLEKLFFLTHQKELVEKIVRPDFIKYTYRTVVFDKSGRIKATCEGTCNTHEIKYRYTTVFENEATEEQKRIGQRITKKSKKGNDYTVIRIEKKDFSDIENTIMKMAQKRSYVGAILEATNSSGRFTQDVEDMDQSAFSQQTSVNSQQTPSAKPASDKQKSYIQNLIRDRKVNLDELISKFGRDVAKYDAQTASRAIEYLQTLPERSKAEKGMRQGMAKPAKQDDQLPTIQVDDEEEVNVDEIPF